MAAVPVLPVGAAVASGDDVDGDDGVDAPANDMPSPRLAPNEHAATAPTAIDRLSLTFISSSLSLEATENVPAAEPTGPPPS